MTSTMSTSKNRPVRGEEDASSTVRSRTFAIQLPHEDGAAIDRRQSDGDQRLGRRSRRKDA